MARLVAVAGIALVTGILIGIGWFSLQRSAQSPEARAIQTLPTPTLPLSRNRAGGLF